MATTVSNAVASVYYLWFFLKKADAVSISPRYFTLAPSVAARTLATGLPTGMFSALMSLSTLLMNQCMTAWGNGAVAAIGIVFKANMFVSFIQMGIANGIQPLLGYAYGAGNAARFKAVERYTRRILVAVGTACTVLYLLFPSRIISLFIDNAEVVRFGVPMLVAYTLSGPFIGLFFLAMGCLQSTGRPLPATLVSAMRNGILLIPLMYAMRAAWGFTGLIAAQAVTDAFVTVLAVALWRHAQRSLDTKKETA